MTESKPKDDKGPATAFPVPEDNPNGTKYAIYDALAGRYVDGSVGTDKPAAPKEAHLHVVRV